MSESFSDHLDRLRSVAENIQQGTIADTGVPVSPDILHDLSGLPELLRRWDRLVALDLTAGVFTEDPAHG